MKKQLSVFLLSFGLLIPAFSQKKDVSLEEKLIQHFQKVNWTETMVSKDSLFTVHSEEKFNVSLSDALIEFNTAHVVIRNPYFADKYENAIKEREYVKNFPKSYSVIYEDRLVSLFENGRFACYTLDELERDVQLENELNTKKFTYHWIIDGQLTGLSGGSVFVRKDGKWSKFKEKFPLKDKPIIFEDKHFIVFGDCLGEWGGTVYFFEKASAKTFFTESTCANSVIKDAEGYHVLAHLGHGSGFSDIKIIPDPRKLSLVKTGQIGKSVNGQALGYVDKSNAFRQELDVIGLQIFSSFRYQGRELYIVHLAELTFIAEIKDGEIQIAHPLFLNELYTNDPITKKYGEYVLVNLDLYTTGLNREIAVLIIHGNQISKLDWNEDHNR
ncbi:MAG: hypothetical protein AAF206_16590 [Bacteroidota bacterium]